jgi:hypothetical protein
MKTLAELRLECLRLVFRHDQDALTIIARARAFESYMLEPKESADSVPQIESKKTVGKTSTRSN